MLTFLYFLCRCFAFFLSDMACFVNLFVVHSRRADARLVQTTLLGEMQQPRSIFEINLFQYPVRQAKPINPPPPLRRCWSRGVIEVFVLSFQKAVIDIVQLVIEDLLWRLGSVGNSIGPK